MDLAKFPAKGTPWTVEEIYSKIGGDLDEIKAFVSEFGSVYNEEEAETFGMALGQKPVRKGKAKAKSKAMQKSEQSSGLKITDFYPGWITEFGLESGAFESNPIESLEKEIPGDRGVESVYSDALAKALGGQREYQVPTGFIDVLTDSQVIEVKHFACWKHAVGQVCMYGLYFPLKQKRVHLFGRCKAEQLKAVTAWAGQVGVVVTHEN